MTTSGISRSDADLRAGHRNRLREKVLSEPSKCSDEELLELLLGYVYLRRDNKLTARRLIQKFNDLGGVLYAQSQELGNVLSSTEPISHLTRLLKEIFLRVSGHCDIEKDSLSFYDIMELGRKKFRSEGKEEACAVLLDSHDSLIAFKKIKQGQSHRVSPEYREIAEIMFKNDAAKIVLMHNHPSGICEPSEDDRKFTLHLEMILKSLDFVLLDHLIFTEQECFSFRLGKSIRFDQGFPD